VQPPTLQVVESTPLRDACGVNPKLLCEWVFERTDNKNTAALVDWLVDRPLRILFIIVVAWVLARILRNAVTRFADRLAGTGSAELAVDPENPAPKRPGRMAQRRAQRVRAKERALTLGAMLRSLVGLVVWTTAGFMVVGELGVSLGPLIASAGIAGIAIGFGAQSIVRDFLAGVFVVIEDQYGVGDVIDVGEATGTVEEVGFRTTRIRDVSGVLWTVPNGVMQRVGNYSQVWSKSIFDMEVSYDTDIDEAMAVMKRVLDDVGARGAGRRVVRRERGGDSGGCEDRPVGAVGDRSLCEAQVEDGIRRGRDRDPVPAAHRMGEE